MKDIIIKIINGLLLVIGLTFILYTGLNISLLLFGITIEKYSAIYFGSCYIISFIYLFKQYE